MVISARHLLATGANLRMAHERQQERALWEEEYSSCRRCESDSAASQSRCGKCINDGGKETLFKERARKTRNLRNKDRW
jgi:hypothetical protein